MTLKAPTIQIILPLSTNPTTADGPRIQTENKMNIIILSANKQRTCMFMLSDKLTSELLFQVINRLT